jgi:hypothetical protein
VTTALAEAGIAITAGLAAIARGGCFLWQVWRHRTDYPDRPGRTDR